MSTSVIPDRLPLLDRNRDLVHGELRRRAADAGTSLSEFVVEELRRVATRSLDAETLLRSALREWSVPREQILAALDEGRSNQ